MQRRQRRGGHLAGVKIHGAEQSFIARDDFERHDHRHHFDGRAFFGGLREVADGGGVDVEGQRLLQAETDQRELLFGRRREGIEIENADAGGVVRKNQRGAAALARIVERRDVL